MRAIYLFIFHNMEKHVEEIIMDTDFLKLVQMILHRKMKLTIIILINTQKECIILYMMGYKKA